jgi:hypothetical protein
MPFRDDNGDDSGRGVSSIRVAFVCNVMTDRGKPMYRPLVLNPALSGGTCTSETAMYSLSLVVLVHAGHKTGSYKGQVKAGLVFSVHCE